MKRRLLRLIAATVVVGGVMAPAAAVAQQYPTPSSAPTVTTSASESPQTGPTDPGRVQTRTLAFTGGQLAALTVAGLGAIGIGLVFLRLGRRQARTLL